MSFTPAGDPDGYRSFDPQVLGALGFETIMEYGYFLAGEVAEEDLEAFERGAEKRRLRYEIRRDFDLIQINGYTFSSFGAPTDLPADLVLSEYEGDVGMYLVQLKAPMTGTWWQALQAVGEVVAYYPQNTYLVRAAKTALSMLRQVSGVQYVSLYQPAYKVQRSLLTRDEELEVDIEFDAHQDLEAARVAIRDIVDADVSVERVGRMAYGRIRATEDDRRAIAKRPEVIWVEPALRIVFNGERTACVTAGEHDGAMPVRPPGPYGYESWLEEKGFCTPTTELTGGETCMLYWQKVGVVDSGLDWTRCPEASYDEVTGICSDPDPTNRLHWDLNHISNSTANCWIQLGAGESMDPIGSCDDSIVGDVFHCAGPLGNRRCYDSGEATYDFSDSSYGGGGHGTSVAAIIAGDYWSLGPEDDEDYQDAATDEDPPTGPGPGEGFYRGIGIAPSARIVVGKIGDGATPLAGVEPVHFAFLVRRITLDNTRFFNCSWNLHNPYGGYDETDYTLFSRVADKLVRDGAFSMDTVNREVTMVFAAGNTDSGSGTEVLSPANAKNVITVGANAGWDSTTYGQGYGEELCNRFAADGRFEIDNIAHFSRRGYPHEDGSGGGLPRYKPDLVATGTHVAAAASRFDEDNGYHQCFEGTSAAAPAVTAAAVLAETWYWHNLNDPFLPDGNERPSPAMIRAMLIAHANDLQEGSDYIDPEAPTPLEASPSVPQGWGRVNLRPEFEAPSSATIGGLFQTAVPVAVFDQDERQYPLTPQEEEDEPARRFTGTGQVWQFELDVSDPTRDVVVVMVFTDAASQAGDQILDQNDLDLKVFKNSFVPSQGHLYWGNYFVDPISQEDQYYSPNMNTSLVPGIWDSHNTVEVVRVEHGTMDGAFWVEVRAAHVAYNAVPNRDGDGPNQDRALYVFNAVPS